jgi:hypothetical protein
MDPASSAAPTVYSRIDRRIAHFLPPYSFAGDSSNAPPTAPSGMPALTRLFCLALKCRSFGKNRFAPEIRLWSRPESRPPMLAKATSSHVKCRGSLNCTWKKPVSRPPAAASSSSMEAMRASTEAASGEEGSMRDLVSVISLPSSDMVTVLLLLVLL